MFSQLTRYAAELDIPIEDAEIDIRMSYDKRGKLLLEEGVSPGAQWCQYTLDIKSPAPPDSIRKMIELIERGCHTLNTLRDPVPVSGTIVHNDVALMTTA